MYVWLIIVKKSNILFNIIKKKNQNVNQCDGYYVLVGNLYPCYTFHPEVNTSWNVASGLCYRFELFT